MSRGRTSLVLLLLLNSRQTLVDGLWREREEKREEITANTSANCQPTLWADSGNTWQLPSCKAFLFHQSHNTSYYYPESVLRNLKSSISRSTSGVRSPQTRIEILEASNRSTLALIDTKTPVNDKYEAELHRQDNGPQETWQDQMEETSIDKATTSYVYSFIIARITYLNPRAICQNCHQAFDSHNKLHKHIPSCKHRALKRSINGKARQISDPSDLQPASPSKLSGLPTIHAKSPADTKGHGFRTWHYATVKPYQRMHPQPRLVQTPEAIVGRN